MKVAIVTPSLGKVRIEWAVAFKTMTVPVGIHVNIGVPVGFRTNDARNLAVADAVENGADLIIFYDDDMCPESVDTIAYMVNVMKYKPEIDVLGVPYPMKGTSEPIVIQKQGDGYWYGWRGGGLHKVWMSGTGLCAIRLSSLDRIEEAGLYEITKDSHQSSVSDEVKRTVKNYFQSPQDTATDDFFFANLCEKAGLNWYVTGETKAQQIDIDGRIWDIEDSFAWKELGTESTMGEEVSVEGGNLRQFPQSRVPRALEVQRVDGEEEVPTQLPDPV